MQRRESINSISSNSHAHKMVKVYKAQLNRQKTIKIEDQSKKLSLSSERDKKQSVNMKRKDSRVEA